VIKFNEQTITSASDLTAAVRLEKAKAQATLVVVRGGQEVTVSVTLGDAANAK
jgi:S1-C subfamily serine protease